jgi:hypothetical protein
LRQLRYPPRVLYGDYLRSAAGLLVGFGVLLAVPPSLPVVAIFGSLAGLFTVFCLRTLHRHSLKVAVTDEAIACRGVVTKVIAWRDLTGVKLRYFGSRRSQRRPAGSGFMQLTLTGGGTGMTFESSLEGFDWLAGRAAAALRAGGRPLDPATASNLIDLGIDPDDPGGPGAAASDGCHSSTNSL